MRNVILIGAGCSRVLADYLCKLGVPVLTTWQGADLVPEDSPVFCGRPGVIGQRAANIIQQKAEQIFVFGARLDDSQVNYSLKDFAPKARKVVYDIDVQELEKYPADWFVVRADLSGMIGLPAIKQDSKWLKWCRSLYQHFRPELDATAGTDFISKHVDPYYFVRKLSDACQEGEMIVPASSGMQSCALMQAFKVKRNQRIMLCNTIGSMGFEPMAIGAAVATGKRVVMVSGDGGFFMNMQELEVVKRLDLNIKYFVFVNGGYGSITTMQDARFGLRVGADKQSGFTLPDLCRVATVWDIPYHEINSNAQMDVIERVMQTDRAAIVRVSSSLDFKYACKVQASLKDGVFVNDRMEDLTPKIADLERIMNE